MDINKVWLSGVVKSPPRFKSLNHGTSFATFELEVKESFIDRFGETKFRSSYFIIENFGKNAERLPTLAKLGSRVIVEGYLRSDFDAMYIRSFSIYEDKTTTLNHRDGLKHALDILKNCTDLKTAQEKIEKILKENIDETKRAFSELPEGGA